MSVNEVQKALPPTPLVIKGSTYQSQTFAIGDEDHTLGNSLRHVLMNSLSDVEFAGYSVPHPSEPVLQLRIQHTKGSTKKVAQSLVESCGTLGDLCDIVKGSVETRTGIPDDEMKA
ncbi:hypothetical protein TeGR_g11704 [Tetraparma gracilis]|jgi:DNA-directed RNA polymerase I and III subunit RPAC2|uniref:DNA-directed RNA polymerase RBP11-like dimerisation domain-containing protein n=1 Tax=Tetraparma gracilis TaxID=2962635 RepID=A0ABQ6M8I6_9STRA|nr:hypothetical protein TeGR_g11704 [Tetraparma gracilis]